jgi:tetratricopeptide (TPR) repeat protein
VDEISSESAADTAVETATVLMEDLEDGLVREDKEPRAIAEAKALFEAALDYYRREGKADKAAEQVASLGYMARHVEDDTDQAQTLFAEAAALFEQLGNKRRRLATLMQWGEIDPALAAAEQAVAESLDAGLPENLHHTEDPKRLAFAKRLAGDLDGSLTMYEALLEDALTWSRNARGNAAARYRPHL